MGDYFRIRPLYALSDFTSEEQSFLNGMWDNALVHPDNDRYFAQRAERERLHAELHLPGTAKDWEFIFGLERDGRRYVHTYSDVPKYLTPPFPRYLSRSSELSMRWIPVTWHAVLAAPETVEEGDNFYLTIAEARRSFGAVADAIETLMFRGSHDVAALAEKAPPGSLHWAALRRFLTTFQPHDYAEAATWLSREYGASAMIKFATGELIQYSDGKDDERRRALRQRTAAAKRLLEAAARMDVAALAADADSLLDPVVDILDLLAWSQIANRYRANDVGDLAYLLAPDERAAIQGLGLNLPD